MPSFVELLAERPVLLADGATGTNYQNMGIEPGVAPEEWVVDAPDKVQELHRRFVDAGSELVLTCSFGGSSLRLADEALHGRAVEVNRRAAELARDAVGPDVLGAASLGPTGHATVRSRPLRSRRRRSPRAASTCSCSRRSSPATRASGLSRASRARATCRLSSRTASIRGRRR